LLILLWAIEVRKNAEVQLFSDLHCCMQSDLRLSCTCHTTSQKARTPSNCSQVLFYLWTATFSVFWSNRAFTYSEQI